MNTAPTELPRSTPRNHWLLPAIIITIVAAITVALVTPFLIYKHFTAKTASGRESFQIESMGGMTYLYRMVGDTRVELGNSFEVKKVLQDFADKNDVKIISIAPEMGEVWSGLRPKVVAIGAYVTHTPLTQASTNIIYHPIAPSLAQHQP